MKAYFLMIAALFVVGTATVTPPEAYCASIWTGTTIPGVVDSGPDSAVELGVKFRSDISGTVTGIRFYKAGTNTGTHTGTLWSSSGTRLVTGTFSNETASGWQQLDFATPVAISANTVYVASYHTNSGHYSDDQNFFAGTGVDNAPLHALADGVSGANGVYVYGSGNSYPNLGWRSSNYWVDVVFSATTLSDTTPPTVTAFTIPASASTLTVAITSLTATDNVGVTGYLVNESATKPSAAASGWTATVPASYTCATAGNKTLYAWARDAAGNVSAGRSAAVTITLTDTTAPTVTAFTIPSSAPTLTVAITSLTATDNVGVTGYLVNESATKPSAAASGWTATVPASYTCATAGNKTLYAWARDAAGNVSAGRSAAVTITLSATDPILIISSTANPFSSYYAEILRTEGFNAFDMSDISSLSSAQLASYDVVILGEMPLTASQVTTLSNWVNAGGRLVAMRPDKKLAPLLGLSDLGSIISNAYLLVDTQSDPGAGIVDQTIQYHGPADLYALNGASMIAALYFSSTTGTSNPAVTLHAVGTSGGQAAAFAYDLARSVIYTRQGNPAWAGQERDGQVPIRSDDLYYGNAIYDPESDWIDLDKVDIPQADEQQRLLANLIILMNIDKKPLPRFWYFPRNLPAVVVMTGDDHGTGGTAGRFDEYSSMSPSGCSVANWECIRSTSYIYTSTPLSNAQASAYNNSGFEVALHVSTDCLDWTPTTLRSYYSTQLGAWKQKYTSVPSPVTNRTHCIVWSDYATQPAVELSNGMRFDANYYYWPPGWVANSPGLFTGSAMPMRFADVSGSMIDVYQAATQMTDESGQSYPFTIDTLLDNAIGPDGYYGAFVANMHTDAAITAESDAIVNSAKSRGIPIISSRQMLTWLDGRNASTFGSLSWSGSTMSFTVTAGKGANGLVALLPLASNQTVTRITNNGSSVPFTTATIKGIRYVRFAAANGTYQVAYSSSGDTTPPTITAFVVPATATTLTVPISSFTATDNVAVTGYLVNESATAPSVSAAGWSATAPTSYSFTTAGNKTLYAWAKDDSGNVSAGRSGSIAITITGQGPYTIWPATTIPAVLDSGPDSAVELGVRFRSDTNGTITGIRFYKAGTNTGIHTGTLWSNSGSLLATATFSSETASGWQQVNFATPVAISANTAYVASYHTSTGHYSFGKSFFATSGVDNPPLHALADGVAGANGGFAYGSGSSFPNQGWNSSNYWVDVVFQP